MPGMAEVDSILGGTEGLELAEHDVSVLAKIVFESLAAANVYDWYDKFCDDCLPWRELVVKGKNAAALAGYDFTPSRFVRALSDLESTGLVKVKTGGSEVARITYLWMGQTTSGG